MFPVTNSSQTIIDCLLREASKTGVQVRMNAEVKKITAHDAGFSLQLSNDQLDADYVCIACGGYPKSSMFDWLTELGHTIEAPVPSLFTFNIPGHPITQLMGVSVEKARVKITGTKLEQEGPLLITHWGLSGPAVLRLSAWGARQLAMINWQFAITVNWMPDMKEQELAEQFKLLRQEKASQKIVNKNQFGLPQRLWEFLVEYSGIKNETRWADLPAKEQNKLIRNLSAGEFSIKGKTTFKEEFVTAGGIKLSEVNSNTMMSQKIAGLFFAGEILDVDGITGGFNFQHAWTSGFLAAKSITEMSVA
jgi:predicted Rossmann fold flavoprotein